MIPRPEAGCRYSPSEVSMLVREAARRYRREIEPLTAEACRVIVSIRRVDRYLDGLDRDWVTMREAAFLLCRSKACIRGLIERDLLAGERVEADESSTGRAHWRILACQVREIAMGGAA